MRIYDFDGKVLRLVRRVNPEGDVQARVSRGFAQAWCESLDVINSDFTNPESIDTWSGIQDDSGTLTYCLDSSLKGFSLSIPPPFGEVGNHVVLNVAEHLL